MTFRVPLRPHGATFLQDQFSKHGQASQENIY